MTPHTKPLPLSSPESEPFWEGCRRLELLLQRCEPCGAFWFPPGPFCPECWGSSWQWARTGGRGTVYSFVVFHRAYHPAWGDAIPYAVAVVELDEGPRLPTNVVGCDPAQVRCGLAVEVHFEEAAPGVILPRFRPIPGALAEGR